MNPEYESTGQRAKLDCTDADNVWYVNAPLGKNTPGAMTKKISEAAGCSRVYTNHSLRATSVTSLDHAGYTSRDIMTVSRHRSESSIKHYVLTNEEMKRKMSKTL